MHPSQPRNPGGPRDPRDPRSSGAGSGALPSFEAKLENEEEILDALLVALSKNQLDEGVWQALHDAAVRDDRASELAFAYESVLQGRKLRTVTPQVQAELFFRAAGFFGDVLGDEFGAQTYLEKALAAWPAHAGAFERIDAQLTRAEEHKKLAELCVQIAAHRPKGEQAEVLERAAVLYERAGLEDKAIETYQALVKLDPRDEALRDALEARYLRANRFRDAARMLEQALAIDPPPEDAEGARIRAKLVDLFANQLKEPERSMPHVEALLEVEPAHAEARRVAMRLLESKGLAARAAAALGAGASTTEERARYLTIELENTRGPRRREILRRIGVLKQDELGDAQGAFEAFEQALGIDPSDDELRRRYVELGSPLKGPLEIARTFARVSTVAKDAAVRSRITAEMGVLLLRGGDAKRARTSLLGILSSPTADPGAILIAARALADAYEAEHDAKNLVEVLTRIGQLSDDPAEKVRANQRVAELCGDVLGETERAIEAWRRLVETTATEAPPGVEASGIRERALAALEPLYEKREAWADLAFVLDERARDARDAFHARALAFRAAEVRTEKAGDPEAASEAWRKLVEDYGPARDAYAQWIPILEAQHRWQDLADALVSDAKLAPTPARAEILGRLGVVYLTRTRDAGAAIASFRDALQIDPEEKTSRATLEKLLVAGDHRREAAAVLEPVYRGAADVAGLLRVLEIHVHVAESPEERLRALEEAAEVARGVSAEKALDMVGRGLAFAVETNGALEPWLARFDGFAPTADARKRAAILGKALGEHPVDSPTLLALTTRAAKEHAACGEVAAALALLRRALAFDPTSAELLGLLDELLREQGNPEERVALYRAALERSPTPERRKQLLHGIGSIERHELKNLEAAIGAYRRALKDDPADATAHAALVELFEQTAAWDDLCEELERSLAHATTTEDRRRAQARLTEIASAQGDRERAVKHARELVRESDAGGADLDLIERVANDLGDIDLLRLVLERRVEDATDPREQLSGLSRLAELDREAGNREVAVERLHHAADVARSMGDDEAATALLERIRVIDGHDVRATSQLLELHGRSGNHAAIPELSRVLLELTTDGAERVLLYRDLAHTLAERLDDPRGAFAAAREAFALDPFGADVISSFEALAIRAGLVTDFVRAIDGAVARAEAEPQRVRETPSVVFELKIAKGRALASDPSTTNDAATTFRDVLEHSSDEAQRTIATAGLSALLATMGSTEARASHARWLYEYRVQRAAPEERSRELVAWAHAEENDLADPARALALYKQIIEADPDDYDALAAVSRLSLALGDVEGALASLLARREASEGPARNILDVQIASILMARPGGAPDALERLAGVLEVAPHDTAALDLTARLLHDPEASGRAAEILEKSLDLVEDLDLRVEILESLLAHGSARDARRSQRYEQLLGILEGADKHDQAFATVLRGARELPEESVLWDRAEALARQLSLAEPLALLYEEVLRRDDLAKDEAMVLGQRAVAFSEEWFEDSARVIAILGRMLEIEPDDAWAFDRLKLIFDAQERWDDLFALYDRAAANADTARRVELYEEAAQIAKDFANHGARAIGYLELLLEMKPGNARLSAALERLYERHACHRELIALLGNRLPQLAPGEAQRERVRIASLWLDELGDASSALIVIEDILANAPKAAEDLGVAVTPRALPGSIPPPPSPENRITELLERVLAVSPKTTEVRESVPPPPDGRRDSYLPVAPKRGLVRQRAAALLKERYLEDGHEADLARVLEVELEVVVDAGERIERHARIAALYTQLDDDERALGHVVELVLLEPGSAVHRAELERLAGRIDRYGQLADVLVAAADGAADALKIELLLRAGVVRAEKIADEPGAIDLFFRAIATKPITDAALLDACRLIEPLLARAGRHGERLAVLERLATLEPTVEVRYQVFGEAARVATELEEDERAVRAWRSRLELAPDDVEALDGLVSLFEKSARWRELIDVLRKRSKLERRSAPPGVEVVDPRDLEPIAVEARRRDRVRVAMILSDELDEIAEAIDAWNDVEKAFGHSNEGTLSLAMLYRRTSRFGELAELLSGAAERAETSQAKADILTALGDVQRQELEAPAQAVLSYEAALRHDPRNEGGRAGLRALVTAPARRPDVVRVLLAAYSAADDWQLILDLTEHRLDAVEEPASRIAILMEAAQIAERRARDASAAFVLVRRALLLDPSDEAHGAVAELFRLAEITRNHRSLADALGEAIDTPAGGTEAWARALRFRMGYVLETDLDEPRAAIDAFVRVAEEEPTDVEAARAVIRVAARTTRWDAAAKAIVDTTRARSVLEPALLSSVEDAAPTSPGGWDAITHALTSLVERGGGLPVLLARDIESAIAVWHRDRRGDPDAAEVAYARALTHDPTNAELLVELAKLQRRAKGRPLVESLLRLSQTTGGDLDLLTEAADAAITSVGDRALSKSILERLLKLAVERWKGAEDEFVPEPEVGVSSGTPAAPFTYVERATRELVKIHEGDGEYDKIVDLLVATSALPWATERSRALRHEAARVALEKEHSVERAIALYGRLIDEDPDDETAVARLVDIYRTTSRATDLLALKRRLVGTAKSVEARLALRLEASQLEDSIGAPDASITTLQQNLAETPRHEATVTALLAILEREGRYTELEALLANQGRLAAQAKASALAADLHTRAAVVAEKHLGEASKAIAHLARVIELEPRADAFDELARLSTSLRKHEAAAGYLDRLRDMIEGPRRIGVTLRLFDALRHAGKNDDARQRIEDEVARDPDADPVRVRLADVYRTEQSWRSLAELLTGGAAHAPDKTARLARLREAAELHRVRTGDPERAIPLLEQAADLAPEENAVKLALADALGAAKRYDEARALLRALIEAFGGRRPKERAPVHYHLALLDLAVGDRARALVELDAATRIDPANPSILQTLAELARDDGQLERAERSYRALLTVLRRQDSLPDDAPVSRSEVLYELSKIALSQGEPDRANEILESAFELATESAFEGRRLERLLRAANDYERLVRSLEARVAKSTSQADVADTHAELARIYEEQLGRREDALAIRLRALELAPGSDDAHEAASRLAAEIGDGGAYENRLRAIAARLETEAGEHREAASEDAGLVASKLLVRLAKMAESAQQNDRDAAALYERAVALGPAGSDARELFASLDRLYERLGDEAGQARILGLRVALDAEAGGASSDALYRLAQLRFKTNDVEAACDALEAALEGDADATRAEIVLKEAGDAHPDSARVVELYERLARSPGRERTLVDALVKRWALSRTSFEPLREAIELTDQLGDKALGESLLRRALENGGGGEGGGRGGGENDREGRAWALARLARMREEEGDVREALVLKREAADLAEPEDARRLLHEIAGLASGPIDDLVLAATIYEQLHEQDASDRDAWEMLLDVYRRTRSYDKLASLLQEVTGQVDDPGERSKLRLERVKLGLDHLHLSDEDAATELRDIVDEDPSNVDVAILLGTLLERSGREDDLVELLGKQLDAAKDRQDADAVSSLSRRLGQLLEVRDPPQARDVYEAALDWDPRAKEILVALEALHRERGDEEARADAMEKRLALEHGAAAEALALELAALRAAAGDVDASQKALEVGYLAAPASRTLRERLEATYREQLEYEKLAKLYIVDATTRTDPESKIARLREAAKLYRDELSDPEEGARVLRDAYEADSGNVPLLLELVDTLAASGELKDAVDKLTSAIDASAVGADVAPEGSASLRADLLGRRATLLARLGESEGACDDFERAIALGLVDLRTPYSEHLDKLAAQASSRNDMAAWRGYRLRTAQLRVETGDIEDARNVLTELLKTDSKDKGTLRAIAHVDELEGRWDAASATYRRLVGLEDEQGIVSAALKLADVCQKAGRLADARGGLERARLVAPQDSELRQRLAWVYEQLGATAELATLVLEGARAAGDVAPRFAGLVRAGQLYLELARDPAGTQRPSVQAAIVPLEEAHALRPADLDCAALLSDAYVGAGRFEEAQELLSRTIGSFKGRRARELSVLYHRLARVAEMLGDRAAEMQHLSSALDMDGQNGAVASELAYLAMEGGNLDVAQRALRAITMTKGPTPLPRALAYQHLGEIARHQGDPKRAAVLLKRAIDEDPSLETARALLAAVQAGG